MSRFKFTIFLFLSFFASAAFGQWVWQNPLPQGNTLQEVYFIPEVPSDGSGGDVGYAVGFSGTILKTTDGGISWVIQPVEINYDLYSLYFIDENYGFARSEERRVGKECRSQCAR